MLEKPALSDDQIRACLQSAYGLAEAQVAFLPLGVDEAAAVYRVTVNHGLYFLKLRSGAFDDLVVALTTYLHEQGLAQIIPPLKTRGGRLWARLGDCSVFLYPFIESRSARQVVLTAEQWAAFGAALKKVHTLSLPPDLQRRLPREKYTPYWREQTLAILEQVEQQGFADPLASRARSFLQAHSSEIAKLVQCAARHAEALTAHPPEQVLCHADIHAGNLLVAEDGAVYITDWDDALLAPKERDLMYIGGGQGFAGHEAWSEETLFYRGYGRGYDETELNLHALAYYRCERIVQDIALFSRQLLKNEVDGPDRAQAFQYLVANFQPGGTLALARQTDRTAGQA